MNSDYFFIFLVNVLCFCVCVLFLSFEKTALRPYKFSFEDTGVKRYTKTVLLLLIRNTKITKKCPKHYLLNANQK